MYGFRDISVVFYNKNLQSIQLRYIQLLETLYYVVVGRVAQSV